MRKQLTGEPVAGKLHTGFGGRGRPEPFPTPIQLCLGDKGRGINPDGLPQSVELHEAPSPFRPSAKEKLIPLVQSAATGR
jgi:hypothetical protein